ncbi:GMC oxidoreductase [Lecanosticta acicola]|uniref:GMC oxidoreductase n=1 Tax=Lecanosticta acicola TaxID=111012 RepID=A0AAI8YRJ4_9PEZI|nr:GMC oxidoreductase [Lecanosticta acicola]
MAQKLRFNGTTATGVDVVAKDLPFTLTAKKEVIVSCGAFQSPQLLMVSGIGPSDVLKNFSIPVIADKAGVGQDMWDNPIFGITYAVDVETSSAYTNSPARMARAVQQYNSNRTGYLLSSGTETISFEALRDIPHLNLSASAKQSLCQFPSDWPDVEFVSLATWYGPYMGSTPPTMNNYESLAAGLIAPLSRGSVSIKSANMSDSPIINPGWLTHSTDQELAIAAVRRAREYAATPAFRSITIGEEAFPGKNVTTDAQILTVLREQTSTFYHASATCKMGRSSDSMAVVDSKGRVFGVNKLRVVDIFAMPFLPPGQPQATVYMLAEKIADEILIEASRNATSGNATYALV